MKKPNRLELMEQIKALKLQLKVATKEERPKKPCAYCSALFVPRQGMTRCSEKCRLAMRREREKAARLAARPAPVFRLCLHCNADIAIRACHPNQTHCPQKTCQSAKFRAARQPPPMQPCKCCGELFARAVPNQKKCHSPACELASAAAIRETTRLRRAKRRALGLEPPRPSRPKPRKEKAPKPIKAPRIIPPRPCEFCRVEFTPISANKALRICGAEACKKRLQSENSRAWHEAHRLGKPKSKSSRRPPRPTQIRLKPLPNPVVKPRANWTHFETPRAEVKPANLVRIVGGRLVHNFVPREEFLLGGEARGSKIVSRETLVTGSGYGARRIA